MILVKGSFSVFTAPGEVSFDNYREFHAAHRASLNKKSSRADASVVAKADEVPEFCYISSTFFNKRISCGATIFDEWHLITSGECVEEYEKYFVVKL